MAAREMVLHELKLERRNDGMSLAAGEATRFQEKCERYLAELTADKEKGEVTAVSVHRIIVRLTWAFFYARKGAVPAEHERLLLVFLGTLEQLHERLLAAEPMNLTERIVVEKPPRRSSKQAQAEARKKTIADLLGEP